MVDHSPQTNTTSVCLCILNPATHNPFSDKYLYWLCSFKVKETVESIKENCPNLINKIQQFQNKDFIHIMNGVEQKYRLIFFNTSDLACLKQLRDHDLKIFGYFCSRCMCHYRERMEFKELFRRRQRMKHLFVIEPFWIIFSVLHCIQRGSEKLITELALVNLNNLDQLQDNIRVLLKDMTYTIKKSKNKEPDADNGENEWTVCIPILTKAKKAILLKESS
jgi:hypothetical protein